jgi:hypothetical protein
MSNIKYKVGAYYKAGPPRILGDYVIQVDEIEEFRVYFHYVTSFKPRLLSSMAMSSEDGRHLREMSDEEVGLFLLSLV